MVALGEPGGGWAGAGRVLARARARATHAPWMCPICRCEGLRHVDWHRRLLPRGARCAWGGRQPCTPAGVPVPLSCVPSEVTPSHVLCTAPVRCQLPAVCQRRVPTLYCGSMAIDFSSHVNLDGLGLWRVFVHVWLSLSRSHGRSIPCWSPQPTHPLLRLWAVVKLEDIQKTSLVKSLENSGFINQLLVVGSAVYVGYLPAALPSPRLPGQHPQPLLRHPVRT